MNETSEAKKPFKSIFKGIFSFLILYVLANCLLWLGQELYYKKDMDKCENIKLDLVSLKNEVDNLEKELSIFDSKKEEIEKLGGTLRVLSGKDVKEYNMLIDEYNKNVPKYKYMIELQKEKYEKYNRLVSEYNTIAKYAYSRWWLLPFPIPGSMNQYIFH